jgi:putative DNA primase/helicase
VTCEIPERQEQLDRLCALVFVPKATKAKGRPSAATAERSDRAATSDRLTDEEVIAYLTSGKDPKGESLWRGSLDYHDGDASRADMSLIEKLYWLIGSCDQTRADKLFRRSGLMRDKWDERHSGDGRTYGLMTLEKQAKLQGAEFYSPQRAKPGASKNGDGREERSGPEVAPPASGKPHLTDLGNAQRIYTRHGRDLHYCHPWKSWFVWDGRRWALDETAEVVRRAKDTIRAFQKETQSKLARVSDIEDEDKRTQEKKAVVRDFQHGLCWEDNRNLERSIASLRSEPSVPVLPSQLDSHHRLLNLANGTLDLDTATLRPHDRADLLTKLGPVEYDAGARCPLWLSFLNRIMDGNTDLIDYLQRLVGYGLTADVSEQSIWFFHGAGANGKSTFLSTVLALMGDYGMQAVSDLLMVKANESHPTERADLLGKRFVCTIETEEGKRLAESLMKQLTGEDRIRARRMRQDFFEFQPTHKIIMAANHKPVIRGRDLAVWRRIKLVPFTVTIPEEEKDKQLPKKLRAELPGILNWAVDGYRRWAAHGMAEPDEVRAATAEYQREQDLVAAFIAECCCVLADARVKSSLLFESYKNWSGDKFMTQKDFSQQVVDKGFRKDRGQGGAVFFFGIGLPAAATGEDGRAV